jgi:OOP family OmpA-OmpF porin
MTSSARSVAIALGCASLLSSATILAHEGGKTEGSGYVGDMNKHYVTDGFGNCVRTGTWSKDQASAECDPDLVVKAPEPAPEPEPVAAAMEAPAPAPVVPQTVTKDISLGSSALFDVNKASLKPEGMAELDDFAASLGAMSSIESIEIVGHTDSTGADSYNQMLSEKRANSVRDYLESKGVDPSLMSASGRGETQPVADNTTREGRAQNRRVEISVKGTEVQ